MKSILRFLLAIFLLFSAGDLCSQDHKKDYDKVYGLDPLLYNGKKYTYFLPPGTGGHQYLLSPDYFIGAVTIRGKRFQDITLNLDIYNQQLLLRYADEKGAFNIIEISRAWLESFRLGDIHFTYSDYGEGPRFYQVLGEGSIKILFYWRKDLKLDLGASSSEYTFTPAIRSSFIMKEGKIYAFRSKSSLLAIFDPSIKGEIKTYMRQHRIKLKKASDQVMTDLINYIDKLR